MKKNLFIGPAGWIYKDWESRVYPTPQERGFDPLVYIAQYFNVVEINSSFYRPPTANSAAKWADKVRDYPEFLFTYKLWQGYTHNRDNFPDAQAEKVVKSSLDVLQQRGRLGALLIQFPWSFKNTAENLAWLERVIATFRDYLPVVEVRHGSWNTPDFFEFLTSAGATFANIDQPVIGQSIGLTAIGSRQMSYLRLHGRNMKNWFAPNRYDYYYQPEELESICQTVEKMISESPRSFIIFNNHFRGQGIANALQMMYLLSDCKVNVPAPLLEVFPQLRAIAREGEPVQGQTELFTDKGR